MGNWKIIVPESTVNLVPNPSFEVDLDGWSEGDANNRLTYARSTLQQRRGAYSCLITAVDGGGTCQVYTTPGEAIAATASTAYRLSVQIYLVSATGTPAVLLDAMNGASWVRSITTAIDTSLTNQWQEVTCDITLAASGENGLQIRLVEFGLNEYGVLYVDEVQLEQKSAYRTTYCDGDQDGCSWDGEPHNSSSTRSAGWRGGGRVRDLKDYFGFAVTRATGVGAAAIQLSRQPFATIPGSRLTGLQQAERVFALTGNIIPNDSTSTHSRRVELTKILHPNAYPKYNGRAQPVRLRYTGASTDKEISAHYEGGLEADWTVQEVYNFESATIRFYCEDPYWYRLTETAKSLDVNDHSIARYALAYLRDEGRWDTLNVNNAATAFTRIWDVTRMRDGKVWYCGDFEGWNGTAGMDMIAVFDPSTRQWEKAGPGTSFGGDVYRALQAANGTVYVVGAFNPGDGSSVTNAAKLVGNTWVTLGAPGTHTIVDAEFAPNGNLYVVGNWSGFAGKANTAGISFWDGSDWNGVGNSGGDAKVVDAIAIDDAGHPYIMGQFTNYAGSAALDRRAWYNGTTWAEFGGATPNSTTRAMAFSPGGILYIVGAFSTPGTYAMRFTGAQFEALGDGLSGQGYGLVRAPDGLWYLSSTDSKVLKWDGTEFTRMALTVPTGGVVTVLDAGIPDPVHRSQYDIWVGCDSSGTAYYAGTATATTDGSTRVFPYLKFKREGGTSATLLSILNRDVGVEIGFDYDLQDGEELTIDFRPHKRNIISSHRGQQWAAARRGSSIVPFYLQRGDNDILTYVEQDGGTVTANLVWRDAFEGFDG